MRSFALVALLLALATAHAVSAMHNHRLSHFKARASAVHGQQLRTRAAALLKLVWPRREVDSLMSWRERDSAFSDEHEDIIGENGVRYVSPAQLDAERALMERGVDTRDVDMDHPRFAELKRLTAHLSQEAQAALQTQLAAQNKRRASAHARASARAIDSAHCEIVKSAIKKYKTDHNAWPTADQAWVNVQADKTVSKPSQADTTVLHTILMYRLAYVGWAAACSDATALATDATALAILAHPPTTPINAFYMGIEEELTRSSLNPDPDSVDSIAESVKGAEPRVVPHLKVVPDHSSGPIVELATGPLPITTDGRLEHRLVVNTWDSKLPAYVGDPVTTTDSVDVFNGKQTSYTIKAVSDAFDGELGKANMPPVKYQLTKRAGDTDHRVGRRKHPEPTKTYNNIQVNFEASLCAYYQGKRFFELTQKQASKDVDMAAFKAAGAYVSGGLPGITTEEIANLPPQQLCELKGLVLLYVSHSLWNQISDIRAYQREYKKVIAERKLIKAQNKPLAKEDRKPVPPLPESYGHWGGTSKNFFNVMVKTPLHSLIPLLPFPLSDVVHRMSAAYEAMSGPNKNAENKRLHDLVIAKLSAEGAAESWARKYAGDEPLTGEKYLPDGGGSYNWLADYRGAFRNYVAEGKSKVWSNANLPCTPPIDCSRAPFAEIYHDNGKMQLALICEARLQYDPLNRAMNEDAVALDITTQLKHLTDSTSFWFDGAGTVKSPPWPAP